MRTSRPPTINTGDYRIRTMGGNVKFGVPFTELDTVFFGVGVERTEVEVYQNITGDTDKETSPLRFREYVHDFNSDLRLPNGSDPGNEGTFSATTTGVPLTAAWQRDSRDSALVPTKGRYQRANFELSALGDLKYYRASYQHQYFQPLGDTTIALNGEIGYAKAFGSNPYPIFKNFYAGGIGSVRGYEGSSLGPKDSNGDAIGGTSRLIANVEWQFPFPGSASNDRTLRWFTFFDAGNVYGEGDSIGGDLKYSAGVGFSWVSPIGPLKLSYGKALNAKTDGPTQDRDNTQSFQFQLGTGF
jgi:outer membrane protein insertion porin family